MSVPRPGLLMRGARVRAPHLRRVRLFVREVRTFFSKVLWMDSGRRAFFMAADILKSDGRERIRTFDILFVGQTLFPG